MNTKSLVRIALFAAITAVLSQVVIPLSFVPISLGTFAVYSCALFLTPKEAMFSQLLYLILGLIGLPVFSNFNSGIVYFVSFTGGFLFSYPFVAYVCAIFRKLSVDKKNDLFFVLGIIIATVICYIFGVLWFSYIADMNIFAAIKIVVIPFILGDLIKIGIIVYLNKKIRI